MLNVFILLDTLIGKSSNGTMMDLLWENPNPTINFDTQTVNLEFSKYKYLIILYKVITTQDSLVSLTIPTDITNISMVISVDTSTDTYAIRNTKITSQGIWFEVGIIIGHGLANHRNIPYKIYGIK